MQGRRLTEEQINEVKRLFPDHTKREIHEITGICVSCIDRIQARFHLRKSPEHLHNMGVRAGKASNIARGGDSSACYTPEAIAKRIKTYKQTYKTEDMRARWGLPQLTKIRLKHGCKHQQDQSSYLRRNGYIIDEAEKVAYYTDTTRRSTRLERLKRGEKRGPAICYYEFQPLTQ